jgi:hypothetical protein
METDELMSGWMWELIVGTCLKYHSWLPAVRSNKVPWTLDLTQRVYNNHEHDVLSNRATSSQK